MLRVFIENEAGSKLKRHHDEETLAYLRIERAGAPYPLSLRLHPRHPGSRRRLRRLPRDQPSFPVHRGPFDCEPFALMEQKEGGLVDHNLLAVPAGEGPPGAKEAGAVLARVAREVLAGLPDREVTLGRLLPALDALAYLQACLPQPAAGATGNTAASPGPQPTTRCDRRPEGSGSGVSLRSRTPPGPDFAGEAGTRRLDAPPTAAARQVSASGTRPGGMRSLHPAPERPDPYS